MEKPEPGSTSTPFYDGGLGSSPGDGDGTSDAGQAICPFRVIVDGRQGIGAGIEGDRIVLPVPVGHINGGDQTGDIPSGAVKHRRLDRS